MIRWAAAVREGKEMAQRRLRDNWRWGEIADELEPVYGESTLERYAEEVEMNYDTLRRYRDVYRAWAGENAGRPAFSVAQTLAAHPRRAQIAAANPDMTVREARRTMEQHVTSTREPESPPRRRVMTMHTLMHYVIEQLDKVLERGSKLQEAIAAIELDAEGITAADRRELKRAAEKLVERAEKVVEKVTHQPGTNIVPISRRNAS